MSRDLRAKVEALRDKWQRSVDRDPDGKLSGYDRAHVAALNDVLALLDGAAMNETRYTVASVHHVLPRSEGGQQCLCGVVLLKHRDATEHIVDAVMADLRAKVEALSWIVSTAPAEGFVLRADVLALFDGGGE